MPKQLNLDELYGESGGPVVTFNGQTYELMSREAFGPRDMAAFGKLMRRLSGINNLDEMDDAAADAMEGLVNDMLRRIGPSLPDGLAFLHKIRVIQFWGESVGPNAGAAPQPTGGPSTAA